MSGNWIRVSKDRPCPICGKSDWCSVSADGSAAICPRMADGAERDLGEAGYLHRLTKEPPRPRRRSITIPIPKESEQDFAALAERYREALRPEALTALSNELGVSADSLIRLGIGWNGWAWSFPMRDAAGRVRGIRLRRPDGRKLAETGGHDGLFIPEGLTAAERLMICEGPTDTAAMLDLKFEAIGRPSCRGGARLITELCRAWRVREVIVLADRDDHGAGQRGAESLATVLVCYVPAVRIVHPPPGCNDARDWVRIGATRETIEAAIAAASVKRLRVK